jgi:diguanylate cyclase (GGDEF)-like protein
MLPNVLMVDDSNPIHALVRLHLEPHALELHSAFSGESGLSMAASVHPSLILLDVNMPQIDGFEVCRRLKANPQTTDSAVLFLTGDTAPYNMSKGLSLGAVDYMIKPLEPAVLRTRVQQALRLQHRKMRSPLIDTLTGLWNESCLKEQLAAHVTWAGREGQPVACIMVNVDTIKQPGESFDDVAGEAILCAVADIFLQQCRGSDDTVYCCGENTFAAVLSQTSRAGAERMAERIRVQVENELQREDGGAMARISFGTVDSTTQPGVSLLDRAFAMAQRARQVVRNEDALKTAKQGAFSRFWRRVA